MCLTWPNQEDAIVKKIMKLRSSSAPGPDGITPRILQNVADIVAKPLALLFAASLAEGRVPDDWRHANVTPVFKKGAKSSVGNYRPISLTSIICKIFESILRDGITAHLATNNVIKASQHGFMSKRSCLSNLLTYLEEITRLVDEGNCVDVVYLDFAKAFDKVPHQRLIAKLRAAGIQGQVASWIEMWLTDRQQRVVMNGYASEWQQVKSGVPQGSVLGPTLFLIFINDIDLVVDSIATYLSKFADDTKLFRCVRSEADKDALQSDINALLQWSEDWQMAFNADKCKVMHFGRANSGFTYTMGGFAPGGTVLENSHEEKDLGVLIHDSLKPSSQCAKAVKKANQVLGQMARAFTYRDKFTWVRLYKQYVRPHLEYAVQSWCPWTEADIDALESVQKRAIRMVSGLKERSYEGRLAEVGLTTLTARRKRGDVIEVWKFLHGETYVDYSTLFTLASDGAVHNTRQASTDSMNLKRKPWNLELRRHFFSVRVVSDWNSLPAAVQNSPSLDAFKRKYDSLTCR